MKVYKELEKLGSFEWLSETYKLKDSDMDSEYLDNLSLNAIHRTVCNATVFRWFREKHNLYVVIIPTITMYWTFKTMTVVEGIVDAPPYNHVDANDYPTYEEAEIESVKELIKIVKQITTKPE
jgi:hypothetical protein